MRLRVVRNLAVFFRSMSNKKHWGDMRMDGKYPPPESDEHKKIPRKKRGRHACPRNKEGHEWLLVVPKWHRQDRTGRIKDVGLDEFYATQDAKYFEEKREREERVKLGLLSGWYSTLFWGRRRYYECIHCTKNDSDTEERPNRHIRDNLYDA